MSDGHRTAVAVVDKGGRVIAVLGGRPKGETEESWRAVIQDAYDAMKLAREQGVFTQEQKNHRRGSYATLATGISFGGGQQVRRGILQAG